jgi:hypothetical protein
MELYEELATAQREFFKNLHGECDKKSYKEFLVHGILVRIYRNTDVQALYDKVLQVVEAQRTLMNPSSYRDKQAALDVLFSLPKTEITVLVVNG